MIDLGSVEASLGRQFLSYSFIGTILAIFAVSLVIVAKYRIPKLVFPIVLVNSAEILILFATIGTFGTIDLSAMAGIITLIGTGAKQLSMSQVPIDKVAEYAAADAT
jgi:preprotein translocase subunit SecD